MLQDKKKRLIRNLDTIKESYIKLVMMKSGEREAFEHGNYEFLYELSQNERFIIGDINELMKFVVPDLIGLRNDPEVHSRMEEIDGLQESVIQDSLAVRGLLEEQSCSTRSKLENVRKISSVHSNSLPRIVDLRA